MPRSNPRAYEFDVSISSATLSGAFIGLPACAQFTLEREKNKLKYANSHGFKRERIVILTVFMNKPSTVAVSSCLNLRHDQNGYLYQYLSKSSRVAPIRFCAGSSSSPHDEGVGRGLRRGVATSSPRPSPPSDGGEGVSHCGSAALRRGASSFRRPFR